MKRKPYMKKKMRSLKATRFAKVAYPFGLAEMWNGALTTAERRPIEARDRLWATDMARGYVDVFLSMKGEKATNPPNARALRKFEAGDVCEWVVKTVLIRAGLLRAEQKRVEYQYKGMLPMTARLDYIVCGKPDIERIRAELETMDVPEVFKRASFSIVEHINKTYPAGLPKMPLR